MLMLQNKALQKQWLVRQGIATPAFVQLAGGPADHQALVERFGLPLVQKSATGGFDGRGVQIIGDESALVRLWETPSIVEAFVTARWRSMAPSGSTWIPRTTSSPRRWRRRRCPIR
jgi:phosphoribosylaminoimidazole carboxylase (NCAIR synthetase)